AARRPGPTLHSSLSLASLLPAQIFFPYTTLFRSCAARGAGGQGTGTDRRRGQPHFAGRLSAADLRRRRRGQVRRTGPCTQSQARSEEHTSELQSRSDLVCRLLLEKKKEGKRLARQ